MFNKHPINCITSRRSGLAIFIMAAMEIARRAMGLPYVCAITNGR